MKKTLAFSSSEEQDWSQEDEKFSRLKSRRLYWRKNTIYTRRRAETTRRNEIIPTQNRFSTIPYILPAQEEWFPHATPKVFLEKETKIWYFYPYIVYYICTIDCLMRFIYWNQYFCIILIFQKSKDEFVNLCNLTLQILGCLWIYTGKIVTFHLMQLCRSRSNFMEPYL